MKYVTDAIKTIDSEIAKLNARSEQLATARKALEHLNSYANSIRKPAKKAKRVTKKHKRHLSSKARLAIVAGQKARWAKWKKEQAS